MKIDEKEIKEKCNCEAFCVTSKHTYHYCVDFQYANYFPVEIHLLKFIKNDIRTTSNTEIIPLLHSSIVNVSPLVCNCCRLLTNEIVMLCSLIIDSLVTNILHEFHCVLIVLVEGCFRVHVLRPMGVHIHQKSVLELKIESSKIEK